MDSAKLLKMIDSCINTLYQVLEGQNWVKKPGADSRFDPGKEFSYAIAI